MEPKEKLIYTDQRLETDGYKRSKALVTETLITKVNFALINQLPKEQQVEKIHQSIIKIVNDLSLPFNTPQVELLKNQITDEVLGFGPLELLLGDQEISDIMINSHKQVYVEKAGKIYATDLSFSGEPQLLNIIQKIVALVGRRVDESSPMVDARMPDGSRFNAIIPPLAIDGALVSIRKFKKSKMSLDEYFKYGSMSESMVKFLKICAASRVNILVSGGTGSGKTTLLNALSEYISPGERVVTIEDAAELQLKQPHVLRLESRPANIEGQGAVSQRALLKNALRMRPDRIILGEIRGEEVIDVLQAMNTGHEGSMATIHSNSPRDCLTRIENLIGMTGINLSTSALRQQIASSIHLIVQVQRMRDGVRRVTNITEVVGTEGDVITMQELFAFESGPLGPDGKLKGRYKSNRYRPTFKPQIDYFGFSRELDESLELM
jgi:pilus assembly protein CpaF